MWNMFPNVLPVFFPLYNSSVKILPCFHLMPFCGSTSFSFAHWSVYLCSLIHIIPIYLPKWILGLEFKDQVLPHLQHQNFESPVLMAYLITFRWQKKLHCLRYFITYSCFSCIENLHLYVQMIYEHIHVKNNKFWLKLLVWNLLW